MELGPLIAQCAESRVYQCNFYGFKAVAKHRFEKKYRLPELDTKIREQRTTREARALVRCRKCGVSAPCVYGVDRSLGMIIMEHIDGIAARDFINNCLDPRIAATALQRIGKVVAQLHDGGIIHGDLTTSNFILRGGSVDDVVVIDFGLVQHGVTDEDRAVDLYVLERAVGSTHPLLEGVSEAIIAGYSEAMPPAKLKTTLERLQAVRARGRKRSMIG